MKIKTIVFLILIIFLSTQLDSFAIENTYNYEATVTKQAASDFSQYMQIVREKLSRNWTPPDFLEEGHTRILFKVDKTGKVLTTNIVQSSGDEIYDDSALAAIKKSEPFGNFPQNSTKDVITINYSFDTSFVKTDKMKEYYELSKQFFVSDKNISLKYINLAIQEVEGDDEGYFLYKRRGRIKEALGDHVGAKLDFDKYKSMKSRIDIKRVHALKRQAEIEDSSYAYFYLAYAYEQINDYENAIVAIDKAIQRTTLNEQYKRYRYELKRKASDFN